ncbi:ADP-ribosylglycohydrolase family protein [Sphaerisporangium corydalis]|uniref:ADP-ribosylglycohydrolase family protein n=1 Tax=Sphaerisporangium corydalis TaxID=1441875 RepID=A0ABV9E815_9ACTN|nr:ADP-ribosylglycohydrolase family protein [Sphaerisporangium corydalis]
MSSGDRIRGAFVGLAIGDAAGWPSARHRSALLAPWSRRLERELDGFAEEHRVTTLPVPFTLNQPTGPLATGPSDDAEWLAWTALTIRDDRAEAFGRLAGRTDLRVRISVRAALDNLAAGKRPPASGHDNPHHFDDAAAVRAVAFGAIGADPRADATVTNAGDGVLAAMAMAAAVAELVAGGSMASAVQAALAELPGDTAIGHAARTALAVARAAGDPFSAVPGLDAALVDHVYSYGVAAAQTVPVALALAEVSGGALTAAVPAAACLPSLADSAPALTGALTGAFTGAAALPAPWRSAARTLPGCALPDLAGTDLIDIAEGLT